MAGRGRGLESEADRDQTGPVIGRGRSRVCMTSEIESDERDSIEISRDVVRPIGVTSLEMLTGFDQIFHVVVQTEMTRARETEIRIAREMEAEMARAIEIARDETEKVQFCRGRAYCRDR